MDEVNLNNKIKQRRMHISPNSPTPNLLAKIIQSPIETEVISTSNTNNTNTSSTNSSFTNNNNSSFKEEQSPLQRENSGILRLKLPKDWQSRLTDNNKLGQGGFATVYELLTGTGEIIAVKEMTVDRNDINNFNETMKELILKDLQHENILRYFKVYKKKKKNLFIY